MLRKMDESNSDNLMNDGEFKTNETQGNASTQSGFTAVQMGGQIRLVNLNDMSNVRNLVGSPNRIPAGATGQPAQLLNNNQTFQIVDSATNQVIHVVNNASQLKYPATSQILTQVRAPIPASVSGNSIQMVGNGTPVLKPGSTIQFVKGQNFQIGGGQAFQVVNTINGDQAIQLINPGNVQQQQIAQIVKVSGSNQIVKLPYRANNPNASIANNVIQIPSNVATNVPNIRLTVPDNSGNNQKAQVLQFAFNPNSQQMTFIRPANADGLQASTAQALRQVSPQQMQQKKLLLIGNANQQPTQQPIRFSQQVLAGQQQAGTQVRFIARNPTPLQTGAQNPPQQQQLTFSLLAPKQQVINTQIRDVQDIMQKVKAGVAPVMSSPQTRFVLQAGSNPGIKQAAIQVVGPGGSVDSQGSAVYILTNAPSGTALTQIATSNTPSKNANNVLKSKVLAIQPGTPKITTQGSLSPARAALKSTKIIEQAVAKAQAGGIEIEMTESDGKKKWKRKGEFDDAPESSKKRKRDTKPKVGGLADDTFDGDLDDSNLDADKSSNFKVQNKSLSKKKKKLPPPTFMKKKRRKKDGGESDASDNGMMDAGPVSPYGDGQDTQDGSVPSTRRSCRVVQRKKYVDELDLQLSGDDSGDDFGSRKKNAPRVPVAPEKNQDSQDGSVLDAQDDESSMVIEKVISMRVVQREYEIPEEMENEMNDPEDDGVTVMDMEEFYVKYKNYSYLHCAWKTAEELTLGDKRAPMKIKRFKLKKSQQVYAQEEDEDYLFNPDYTEVDRILDMATTTEERDGGVVTLTHYLVVWKSLPYEEATWELEQDVTDLPKINAFLMRREKPSDEDMKIKARPTSKEWNSLAKSKVYKNENTLREYQLEGLNWLTFCYYNKQNCILADEMGLGKTIQSITFVKEVFDYGIRGPFLIVVPLSTIGNWQREFETWTSLNVVVFHGSQASKNMIQQYEMYYNDDNGARIENAYKFHVLITTFECILSDYEVLHPVEWRVAIFDEAHRLKNRNCKLLQALQCYEFDHKVLLTGTPLQNNVDELFSLLNFLEPKQFSSLDAFMSEFGRLETESEVNKLKALLKPMMLRRLKEDVEKNLAPKEETIVEVELTNIQKKYYRAILERNFVFLAKGANSLPNLMNTMMELRKCCNHPYLITSAEEKILQELKIEKNDYERLFQTLVTSSGKLVLVDKLLPKLKANGHKVLIFSQMIRVLDILEDYMAHKKYPYERIDGRIKGSLRQEAIDRFSKPDSDRFVFLLCTRAGGLGINLTAADTVIIFDSDWNPQNDLQAQARCHRIGQKKSVKVYRLITRNTYEREMFDKASLKLGLDKAVLQSMGTKEMNVQNQMSKKEIEDLLKKGAYGALMDDDNAGEKFCEEDIDQILQRRTQVVQIEAGIKGSTFAKASFNMSTNRTDIDIDDPNFWQKWAKKVDAEADKGRGKSNLIVEMPRQRKTTSRYGRQDNIVDMSDLETSNSDSDYNDFDEEIEGKRGRKRKRGVRGWGMEDRDGRYYTRSDCFKVEKTLLIYGWGRWKDMLDHARFKNPLEIDDVIVISRAIMAYSLQQYSGDHDIKDFILDLITPEDGTEKDYKNHSGLSAPVPRGRKGKKVKKDIVRKSQFEDDLLKLNIDVEGILSDEGYRKHLERQAQKILMKVRHLYYLKHEIVGKNAKRILEGAHHEDINLQFIDVEMDQPVSWWNKEADKSLLIGVFKHGVEKYNLIRNDPCLYFLKKCGPPDERAVLAEQNSEAEELREEEEEDEQKPKKRGRKRKKFKKFKCNDEDDEFFSYGFDGTMGSGSGTCLVEGSYPFPNTSFLNMRLRKLITTLQKCHKQGMMKMEQIAKKHQKREQMKDYRDGDISFISPSNLKNMRLESVGDNPLRLAEQLNWTRKDETEFYRVVSTYGVERDSQGSYIWDTFRKLAKLDKKNDDTLTEYFKAFYHMCMKVCRRFHNDEDATPPNGMCVMTITEERATRCLTRIDLLNRIRENILFAPKLDDRLKLCMPAPYLPSWWICGQHDKDLLVGAAKHGLSRTDYHIQFDPNLSIYKFAKQSLEESGGAVVKDEHNPDSAPPSPNNMNDSLVKHDVKDEMDDGVKEGESKEGLKLEAHDEVEDKKEMMETVDGKNLYVESFKEETEIDNKDAAVGLQSTITEEENVNGTNRLLNAWPKDRLILHRLENICYCVEMGKWRMGHRHHNSYLSSIDGPEQLQHEYTFIQNSSEQMESLRFKVQKKRHRRTKAELEAERMRSSSYHISDNELGGIGTDADTMKMKKHKLVNSHDYHVPVYNTVDGTRLEGDDAPASHELELWLESHPEYIVEREKHRVRKLRLDPSRLSITDCSGEENVTVVNRNTGKKISGVKAPMLMDIAEWLLKNPGFDVDSKWGPLLHQMPNFPKELLSRIYELPKQQVVSFNSAHISPSFVLANHYADPTLSALPSTATLPRIIHHPKNLITAKVISPSSVGAGNSAIQSIQNFGDNFFTQGQQFSLSLVKPPKMEGEAGPQVELNDGEEEIGEEVVEEEVDFDGEDDGLRCDDDDEDEEDGSTAPDEEEEAAD